MTTDKQAKTILWIGTGDDSVWVRAFPVRPKRGDWSDVDAAYGTSYLDLCRKDVTTLMRKFHMRPPKHGSNKLVPVLIELSPVFEASSTL